MTAAAELRRAGDELPAHEEKRQRQRSSLERALGEEFAELFAIPEVREIDINTDGSVWIEKIGEGTVLTDWQVSKKRAETIVMALASEIALSDPGVVLDDNNQALDGKLDFREHEFARVTLTAPPAVEQHTLELRKHTSTVIPLEAMLEPQGPLLLPMLTRAQHEGLVYLLEKFANVVVAGAMFSGKTTFMNGVLQEINRIDPTRRFGYIEYVRELVCPLRNKKNVLATEKWPIDRWMPKTVRWNLRSATIGELSNGHAVNLLFNDLWQQMDGGITSFHSATWRKTFNRAESMMKTVDIKPQREMIAEAIGGIVQLQFDHKRGRIVSGVYEVLDELGSDGYYQVKALGEERDLRAIPLRT
jgi:type IV secretion system protein VirB11